MNRTTFIKWKLYFRILKAAVKTLFSTRVHRDGKYSHDEYGEVWGEVSGKPDSQGYKQRIGVQNGKLIFFRGIDFRKNSLRRLSRLLSATRPQSVCELGTGNGLNVLVLAVLNPHVPTWTGVELTAEGVASAKAMLARPPVDDLVFLTEKSPDEITRVLHATSIKFVQGDIGNISLPDNSFDFVFTHLVLEQMPRTFLKGLEEARRVLKVDGHAAFIEEFAEAQNLINRIDLWRKDYFHASFRSAASAGFKILSFAPLSPDKIEHSHGLLFCKKSI